jgi:hypothetical protein
MINNNKNIFILKTKQINTRCSKMFKCLKRFNIKMSIALLILLGINERFRYTVNAEIFTSTEQMTSLVNTHAQVTQYLREFLISQYNKLEEARK